MKIRLITALLCSLAIGAMSACANTDSSSPSPDKSNNGESVRSTGLGLSASMHSNPQDIEEIQFDVRTCGPNAGQFEDGSFVDSIRKDLSEMTLPGGISKFESESASGPGFDEDSSHLFADAFFLLDAGCYDVRTQPYDDTGEQVCQRATRNEVDVEDGATTEVLLINQCEGAERGGLDVISAINHPPEIEDLEFQKFVSKCPTNKHPQEVCVTASDPDNDPLEFEWEATGAGEFEGDIVQTSAQQTNGSWESCANVFVTQQGDYEFRVTVYDLDGDGNRMEDVLAEQDQQDSTLSRDSITFPVYSGVNCQARRATILMAIGDLKALEGPGNAQESRQFTRQVADWVNPRLDNDDTEVLYVLDDNNQGEHLPQDRERVTDILDDNFDDDGIDEMVEPAGGLDSSDVEGYDLVWFANPGWPMDDISTRNVLRDANEEGIGVVLEGNDMGRHAADEDGLQYFTGLNFLNNGTTTCGDVTDNYSGNTYGVEFTNEPISTNDGLRGESFDYDNDIDHVQRLLTGERMLAEATYSSNGCTYQGAAATAINPIDFLP